MRMNKRRWITISAGMAIVVLLALACVRAPKSVEYETIEIPLPKGLAPYGSDWVINDAGVAAGTLREDSNQSHHLFMWDHDTGLRDLGNPGLMAGRSWITLRGINNKGQLIGEYGVYVPPPSVTIQYRGSFFYDPQEGFRFIGGLKGCEFSSVSAINDHGQVAGHCMRSDPDGAANKWRIFLWDLESGTQDLNLGGRAEDINSFGHILGEDNDGHFIWSPQEGKSVVEPFPNRIIFYGYLDDLDQIGGLFFGQQDSDPHLQTFSWNRSRGYFDVVTIEDRQDHEDLISDVMAERKFLFYTRDNPVSLFGLLHRQSHNQIRLFTFGEGITIPDGIPKMENPDTARWSLNRDGWIVGTVDEKVFVMIPKSQRQTKK